MTKIEDILNTDIPTIAADADGLVAAANPPFYAAYRWTPEELSGKPLSTIIPPALRDAHHMGFSRFQLTRQPKLLRTPLELQICCGDGEIVLAEHFIWHEQINGKDHFFATITAKAP